MKQRLLFKYYQLLGYLAKKYLQKRQPLIIGINGSVGKTSCRMIVHQTLEAHLGDQLRIYTSPKNFNGELGMSLSIFQITEWTPSVIGMIKTLQTILLCFKSSHPKPYDVLILEYGIDRPGEMQFLCSIVQPHISIITKLDAVHSLQFGDSMAIAHEELKLQQNTLLHCYINTYDELAMTIANELSTKITYYHTSNTTIPRKGDCYTTDYTLAANQLSTSHPIISRSTLKRGQNSLFFSTNLIGEIHHSYIAMAYDLVDKVRQQYNIAEPMRLETIHYRLQAGRMSIFGGIEDSILIDSTYNSSPLSLRTVINESKIVQQTLYPDSHLVYVLGDMRELGASEHQHHTELGEWLAETASKASILLLGEAIRTTATILDDKDILHFHTTSRSELIDHLHQLIKDKKKQGKQCFIIFKGSQNTIFLEEVVKQFLLDPHDQQYLTRQGDWRANKKG